MGRDVDKMLLTAEEAAKALSIGRSKVYELLAAGRIDSVRIGTSRRIPATALTRFVESLLDPSPPFACREDQGR